MATTYELVKYLSSMKVEFSLRTHQPVNSAYDRARILRIPAQMVVQTKLIKLNGCCWMVIIPAHRTINFNSLGRILRSTDIRVCDLSDWDYYFPTCEISAVPPLGNLYGLNVLADISFEQGRHIVFGAYSSTQSIVMRWNLFSTLVNPVVAAICDDVANVDPPIVYCAPIHQQ